MHVGQPQSKPCRAARAAATCPVHRLGPMFVPKVLGNMAAGAVSIRHGLRGPNLAPATACAAGTHAIGDAFRLVRDGTADVMVAGVALPVLGDLHCTLCLLCS